MQQMLGIGEICKSNIKGNEIEQNSHYDDGHDNKNVTISTLYLI